MSVTDTLTVSVWQAEMNHFVTRFFDLHCAEKFQNALFDELSILLYMFKHKKTLYNTGLISYRERMILRGVGCILVMSLTNQVNKSYDVAQLRLFKNSSGIVFKCYMSNNLKTGDIA